MKSKSKGAVFAAFAVGTVAPARYLSCPSPLTAPAVVGNQNINENENKSPDRGSLPLCLRVRTKSPGPRFVGGWDMAIEPRR